MASKNSIIKLLHNNNETNPLLSTFHSLFERQVELTPNNNAICCNGVSISYFELNQKANQLAHKILYLKLKKESIIGVFIERGINTIISILAILKVGCAFLLIDKTSLPGNRINFILNHSKASLILVDNESKESLANISPIQFINIDLSMDIESPININLPINSNNLAYTIYTSGTTGIPKQVLIEQKGWVNTLLNQAEILKITQNDKILCASSLSFDAFLWEIGGGLITGASIYLANEKERTSIKKLANFISAHKISIATFTPSVLRLIPKEALLSLKKLISAGEMCTPDLLLKKNSECLFYNAYGLSETSICATISLCNSLKPFISLGRPLKNVTIYVLDKKFKQVAANEIGTLFIGGIGLARSIKNKQSSMENNFINNLLTRERLYNTGDIVRLHGNGDLEWIGRDKEQVKICGNRVNLNEIRYQLLNHPGINNCLIEVVHNKYSNKTKIIAIIDTNDSSICYSKIRHYLSNFLPDYMIPSRVIVSKIALTSSGKVARKNLETI